MQIVSEPFLPILKTHKLKGEMSQFYFCSINYNYRIIIEIKHSSVILLNIGTQDEVY